MLSLMSYGGSIWWKQTQHGHSIPIQSTYSLHNTPKENICLPGTGRKWSCWCTDHAMATSQWQSGYYHNEHLVTALLQLQGQEFSLGCSKFMQTWTVAPCEIAEGFEGPACPFYTSWILGDLSLWALTTHDWSEQASASATTVNELFLGTSQEPPMLNWISLTWSKQDSPSWWEDETWMTTPVKGKAQVQTRANRARWMWNEAM